MDVVGSIPQYQNQQNVHDVDFDGRIKPTAKMDVYSIPQYQKENADAVDYYGRIKPIAKMDVHSIPQYQKENADAVDYYVPNYLRKPSLSDHHKQIENLDVDDLEERLEETRRARSILLSMYGFTPADLWDDDAKRFDEESTRSVKEEKAWRESNTCTSCGRLNWDCWCKINYEEIRAARKGRSTPVKTPQKCWDTLFDEEELFPWLTMCSPTAPKCSCNLLSI